MRCSRCGAEVPDGLMLCGQCGAAVGSRRPIRCPQCGTKVAPGLSICPQCGRAVSVARRWARLAVAVVGGVALALMLAFAFRDRLPEIRHALGQWLILASGQ